MGGSCVAWGSIIAGAAALTQVNDANLGDILVSDATGLDWEAARASCVANGNRDMFGPSNANRLQWLRSALSSQGVQDRHILIGLRFQSTDTSLKQNTAQWKFCDGGNGDWSGADWYLNQGTTQGIGNVPATSNSQLCVVTYNAQWRFTNCNSGARPYVCGNPGSRRTFCDTPTPAPTVSPTRTPSVPPTKGPTIPPTVGPSLPPTVAPSKAPSTPPTKEPSASPSVPPSRAPTTPPTTTPTRSPSIPPTREPSSSPTTTPSRSPSLPPTLQPSRQPTASPTTSPSVQPSRSPTTGPSRSPSLPPTREPSRSPSVSPTARPSGSPTRGPSSSPTSSPTMAPTTSRPTSSPSTTPTQSPQPAPTTSPTAEPTRTPSAAPSRSPSTSPSTSAPTRGPTTPPSREPTSTPTRSPLPPTASPSLPPTAAPSRTPTRSPLDPSAAPTRTPSRSPSRTPTRSPLDPSAAPTRTPSRSPSRTPTQSPLKPSASPTRTPTAQPTRAPSRSPSTSPSPAPTAAPTTTPSKAPSLPPTPSPSASPTTSAPSSQPTGSPTSAPSGPPTGAPTAAPSDKPPGRALSKRMKENSLSPLSAGKSTPAVAAAVGVAAGPSAGTLAVIANADCRTDEDDSDEVKELDWELHPLGFAVGSSRHQYYVGAIIGNALLTFGFALLLTLLVSALSCRVKDSAAKTAASFKYPGINMIVIMFVLPGFSLASAQLLFNSEEVGLRILGGFLLVVFLSLPGFLYWSVLRQARFNAVCLPDETLLQMSGARKMMQVWFCGPNVWVTKDESQNAFFAERWSVCFDAYSGGRHWFVVLEMSSMLAVSVLSAWRPGEGPACDARNGLVILALGLLFLGIAVLRPFICAFEMLVNGFVALATFLAVVLLAVAMADNEAPDWVTDLAVFFLFACCAVVVLKGIMDIATEVYDLVTQRRQATRNSARNETLHELTMYSHGNNKGDGESASGGSTGRQPSTPRSPVVEHRESILSAPSASGAAATTSGPAPTGSSLPPGWYMPPPRRATPRRRSPGSSNMSGSGSFKVGPLPDGGSGSVRRVQARRVRSPRGRSPVGSPTFPSGATPSFPSGPQEGTPTAAHKRRSSAPRLGRRSTPPTQRV
eukprot:TRINITY_DN1915_c0_g1_i1.p1 TRINITY_DN1915_c0_g1~~TRINITY_DN1915_c0_g1_i1.p1  ORF type:complete len:1128 (+),score=167.52 TRINITY_DN1915_c0_g1_i1:52-3384(+)